MRSSAAAAVLAMVLALAGCAPPESYSTAGRGKVLAAGNRNNLYVAVSEGASDAGAFRFWQRDAGGLWHPGGYGQGSPAAVAAWRENLLVFFPTGRYGLFGLGPPAIQPSPVPAWTPVAACEDGLAADAFGWNAAGDPIHARFEDGKWISRRAEASMDRQLVLDPSVVRFAGRLFLVWREEVPTLTGSGPNYRVRFLCLEKDRWHGPVTSRLRVASAPRVAADGGRMICLFLKPAAGEEPERWTIATYATADEDWHETAAVTGTAPGGRPVLARSGEQFFVVSMADARPQAAALDPATGRLGEPVPLVSADEPSAQKLDYVNMAVIALTILTGILILGTWYRARLAPPAADAKPETGALVPAPLPRRAAALVLDYFLVSLPLVPILLVRWPNLPQLLQGETMAWQEAALAGAIRLAFMLGYFSVAEAVWGRTFGKWLLGMEVRREADGGRITVRQALVRNVLRPIDELPVLYLLGAALAVMGPKPQRLGDRVAGTIVVMRTSHDASP